MLTACPISVYEAKPTGNAEFDRQEALRYVYCHGSISHTKHRIVSRRSLLAWRGTRSAGMRGRRLRHLGHQPSTQAMPAPHPRCRPSPSRSPRERPGSVRTVAKPVILKPTKSTAPIINHLFGLSTCHAARWLSSQFKRATGFDSFLVYFLLASSSSCLGSRLVISFRFPRRPT